MRVTARQRGSALLLMPAGVLVLIVLAAIAVDSAVAFLAQRAVAHAADAAANDAASAIDLDAYRRDGSLVLDAERARTVAQDAYDRRAAGYLTSRPVEVRELPCPGDDTVACVEVWVEATVAYVFARAVPGGPDSATVQMSATAALEPGP